MLQREHRIRELRTENPGNRRAVEVLEAAFDEEPIADRAGEVFAAIALQGDERCLRVRRGVGAVLGIEEDLQKGNGGARLEASSMSSMMACELRLGRFEDVRGVLDQEFQLLRQPAADNRVVLVEACLHRLPGQQLLLSEIDNHPRDLFRTWRAEPLLAPVVDEPLHVAFGDPNGFLRIHVGPVAIQPSVSGEKHCPAGDEVEKRLLEKLHPGRSP